MRPPVCAEARPQLRRLNQRLQVPLPFAGIVRVKAVEACNDRLGVGADRQRLRFGGGRKDRAGRGCQRIIVSGRTTTRASRQLNLRFEEINNYDC